MNEEKMLELLLQLVEGQKQLAAEQKLTNQRLDQMDGRLDQMDQRFDQMDGRLDQVDQRLNQMSGRLDQVEDDIQHIRQAVARMELEHGKMLRALFDGDYANREKIVDFILPKLEQHDAKIETLELDVLHLKNAK